MVKTFISNIKNLLDPEENPILLKDIWNSRKEKILSHKTPSGRKQSLGSALLLQKILLQNELEPNDIKIGKNGKPEIEGICFNLSHSDEYVICSTSEKPLGCDIEKIRQVKKGFETRFFTEREVLYLNQFREDKLNQFFRLWTMKESYMKMTSEGMSLALNRFEFSFDNEIKVYRDGILCNCFIKEYEIPNYKISVCSEDSIFADEIEIINLF